jgi:hypothetical protein
MKLLWTDVRATAMALFNSYSKHPERGEHDFRGWTYDQYRTGCQRVVHDNLNGDLVRNSGAWQQGAVPTAFAQPPTGQPAAWSGDTRRLQVQGPSGGNRWLTDASQLQHGDTVVSILHEVHGGQTRSRLQVTVRADRTGLGLYESLRVWLSLFDIVLQWKVLNPQAGATGPDSAVVYLSRDLDDGDTRMLVSSLEANLHYVLEDLNHTPLGLLRCGHGVYGCDVPGEDVQRNVLNITSDFGSAGTIIASVLCRAAWLAASNRRSQPQDELWIAQHGDEAYVRGTLERVVKRDLNWELA